jgi:hypothetical protein
MGLKLANPDNVPREVTTGYQAQNTVLFASMTGYANINIAYNKISEGSVVEVNGVLFKCIEDESIDNLNSIAQNAIFYVYAMPITEDIISFTASTQVPVWSSTKAGYYSNENNRAILRAVKGPNNTITGVVLMTNISSSQIYANTGGVLSYTKNVRAHDIVNFNQGWYRFRLASGAGGGDGARGADRNPNVWSGGTGGAGGAGGVPSVVNYYDNVFYHQGGNLIIHIGGNGFNGSAGSVGGSGSTNGSAIGASAGGGGGGGAGAGEETYIISGANKYFVEKVNGGIGGTGGTGSVSGGTLKTTGISFFSYGGKAGGAGGIGRSGGGTPAKNGTDTMFGTEGFGSGGAGGGGGGGGFHESGSDGGSGWSATGGTGGDGGDGGAPGWYRSIGDGAAGYCEIYFLGE